MIDLTVNYPCDICDKNFIDLTELRNHKKSEHEFNCKKCNFKANTNVELIDHMCDKHKLKEFPCDICGVKLKTKEGIF